MRTSLFAEFEINLIFDTSGKAIATKDSCEHFLFQVEYSKTKEK